MPFTREQIGQAFNTKIVPFLLEQGLDLKKKDHKSMTLEGYGGLVFYNDSNMFHWYAEQKSGNTVKFVQEWYGLDFISAVGLVLNTRAFEEAEYRYKPSTPPPPKKMELPEKDVNSDLVFDYLCQHRGLEPQIVGKMIDQNRVYQSRMVKGGKTFRNCAFVGYDKNQKARYCALRSPSPNYSFRMDVTGSEKNFGFLMEGRSNRVYTFEAPIDAMSHASLMHLYKLDWTEDYRLSQGGLGEKALVQFLTDHPHVNEIVFCYDNDAENKTPEGKPVNQGQEMAGKLQKAYQSKGYRTYIQTPKTKDFNNDLLLFRSLLEEEQETQNIYEERGDF